MGWLEALQRKQKDTGPDDKSKEQDDLELKKITESVTKVDSLETELKSFREETKKTNERLSSFLEEQEAAKRKRIAEEAAVKANKKKEEQDEELSELAITDPVKAAELIAERKMGPLVENQINTSSRLLRKEVFEDNPGKYEYYTNENPEFKAEVDKLIDGLPLNLRANPEAIANCYAVAQFRKSQDIKDGKLKSRFAATSTNSSGNSSTKDKDTVTLTDLQKKAAAALGISEEDYGKTAREMNYV